MMILINKLCGSASSARQGLSDPTVFVASMTFGRKPFRRMRLSVESDITSNATIRRIFVERQLVEWTSVEILSKFGRKMR